MALPNIACEILREIQYAHGLTKYRRYTVEAPGDDVEMRVGYTITHELGHTLLFCYVEATEGKAMKYANYSRPGRTKAYNELIDVLERAKKDGTIYDISEYATTDAHEFFAEAFVMYRHEKNKLPLYIMDVISKIATFRLPVK